jgi:serine-type D-Ala-D-Ala carboxypeptidase (penicillin-binding protein 5/6)
MVRSCWAQVKQHVYQSTKHRRLALAAVLWAAFLPGFSYGQSIDTVAKYAYLLDVQSGSALYQKQADVPTAPASMSKMMTVLMLLERLKAGTLHLDDTFPVSEKAWRMGGSKMFVQVGTRVKVEDLLRGIIVQSGNDACIVVAEGLAGTEEAFAAEMTARAKELGLEHSHFTNSTGWPDEGQKMSSDDLAHLAQILVTEYPNYYELFSEQSFEYNGIRQGNRNPLLSKEMGADGLKTGHTEESGYGLTASAKRGKRRLILVLNGMNSVNERSQEAERLLEWGFRSFESYPLFTAGEVVENVPVWIGDQDTVGAILEKDLTATLMRPARSDMKVTVLYDAPIPAPIRRGDRIGTLTVTAPGIDPIERPLVAAGDVGALGPVGRVTSVARYWISRLIP